MDLIELWNEKYRQGEIRFDPELLEIRAADGSEWGTVYFSEARERYKAEVVESTSTSFDLELMKRMHIADIGGLVIAANPNSLFTGHLVIYPQVKSSELTLKDLGDISALAANQRELTFIHNGEHSAASIVDWAHFQAYAMRFPLADCSVHKLTEARGLTISKVSEKFPAYAIRIDCDDPYRVADILFRISHILLSGDSPQGARIPVNYIWDSKQVWVVPRAKGQSERAARYFGGLEMGGLFCLPNANEFVAYLPAVLKEQVEAATLRTSAESETRAWFEEKIKKL